MRKIVGCLGVLFVILTFLKVGYVLSTKGEASPGYAIIPMLFSLITLQYARKKPE